MLSGRGLCDELATRPEESYRLWCVVVCGLGKKPLMNEEEGQGTLTLRGYRAKENISKMKIVKYNTHNNPKQAKYLLLKLEI
jgi:hypothetical protein